MKTANPAAALVHVPEAWTDVDQVEALFPETLAETLKTALTFLERDGRIQTRLLGSSGRVEIRRAPALPPAA